MGVAGDLVGQTFGRLRVLRRGGSNHAQRATWVCQCECGNLTTITGHALRAGTARSCGCLQRDFAHDVLAHVGHRAALKVISHRRPARAKRAHRIARAFADVFKPKA